MIRLEHIKIIGFKSPNRTVDFTFSPEVATVIYGQNGCGKTTFLRILHAVLSRNEKILAEENVQKIELRYSIDGIENTLIFEAKKDKASPQWVGEEQLQNETSSIFMGMYRGVFQSKFYAKAAFDKEEEFSIISKIIPAIVQIITPQLADNKELMEAIKHFLVALYPNALFELNNKNPQHLFKDGTSIHTTEADMIEQNRNFQLLTSDTMDAAFWLTFEQLMSGENLDASPLESQELDLLYKYKEEILTSVDEDDEDIDKWKSKLRRQVTLFLKEENLNYIEQSPQLRLLLRNIANEFSKIDNHFSPIQKLINVFNDNISDNKKLVVNYEKAFIQLSDGEHHAISALSSGERNLLSLLSLFLLQGKDKNFLILDEPEISLNLKWQRKFISLLSEVNNKAQIIVASHSPAIAKNSDFLRELK